MHGLTAQHVALPDEDPEQFDALREAVFTSLALEDARQDQIVERTVSLVRRLRRVCHHASRRLEVYERCAALWGERSNAGVAQDALATPGSFADKRTGQ